MIFFFQHYNPELVAQFFSSHDFRRHLQGLLNKSIGTAEEREQGCENYVYVNDYRWTTSNQAEYSSFAAQGVRGSLWEVVRKRTFVLLCVADLPSCFHQVLLVDVVPGCTLA
jgi:hypothetical protein